MPQHMPPLSGVFQKSSGAEDMHVANNAFYAARGWPGNTTTDFGYGEISWLKSGSPGLGDNVHLAMMERPGTETGGPSGETPAQFWVRAASSTDLSFDNWCVAFVNQAVSKGWKVLDCHIARESNGNGNEVNLKSDADCVNACAAYRKVIPKMRAAATAGGMKLVIWWNPGVGAEGNYAGMNLAYPGDDMVDGWGMDHYDGISNGLYPVPGFPQLKRTYVASAIAAGLTTVPMKEYQAMSGNTITIGAGTANEETLVVNTFPTSASGGAFQVTLQSATTKAHALDEIVQVTYNAGQKVTFLGQQYRCLVNGTKVPPPFTPGTSNANWQRYPYRYVGGGGTPGVDCMTESEREAYVNACVAAFDVQWYGEGGTRPWYVDKWYQWAKCQITMPTTAPAVHDTPKPIVFREWGTMARPQTSYTGGDNFIFMMMFAAWIASKAEAEGAATLDNAAAIRGEILWQHDNGGGTAATGVPRPPGEVHQMFAIPANLYPSCPPVSMELAGKAYQDAWHPAHQAPDLPAPFGTLRQQWPNRDSAVTLRVTKPGPDSTGLLPGWVTSDATPALGQKRLTRQDGDLTITTAGTVLENIDLYGRVLVRAANVTIRNCRIRGGTGLATISGLVDTTHAAAVNCQIRDSQLRPQDPNSYWNGILGHDVKAYRCDISRTVDGAGFYNTNNPGAALNAGLYGCWVHDLAYFATDVATPSHTDGTHNDAVQVQGGAGMELIGNYLDAHHATDVTGATTPADPLTQPLAAVMFNNNVGNTTAFVIEDNWVAGGRQPFNMSGLGNTLQTGGRILRNRFKPDSTEPHGTTGSLPHTITMLNGLGVDTGTGADVNVFDPGGTYYTPPTTGTTPYLVSAGTPVLVRKQ